MTRPQDTPAAGTPDVEPDFTLDVRGESCPYPVVHTLEALSTMRAGEVLAVTTNCPQSFRNIPERCPAKGHRMVGTPRRDGSQMTFYIESAGRRAGRSGS